MLEENAENQHKYISEEQKEKKNNLKEITLKFLLQLGKKNGKDFARNNYRKKLKKKRFCKSIILGCL